MQTDEYDETESIGLAEALANKAEREALSFGLDKEDVKARKTAKYNEVRRRHAIEFLQKRDERLDSLSNQAIANLLKALIALGLSIEDEEELEYWINLLTREVLLRLNEYFMNRDTASLWRQINSGGRIFGAPANAGQYSPSDVAALKDMVLALKQINAAGDKSKTAGKRIDSFLSKMEQTLQKDLQRSNQKQHSHTNRRRRQNDAFEILKNKMLAEGVESGGRYWNQVVSDFDATLDKDSFAQNWTVDMNAKNEADIQKINELRGIDEDKHARENDEQNRHQQQNEQEKIRQEVQNQLKQEQDRQKAVQANNNEQIAKAFSNPDNQKAAQKYAEKKRQKTGKQLDEKDIKLMKIKAVGGKGR